MKMIVKTITSIQIRFEYSNGTGSNKRFQSPSAAAKDWAFWKTREWAEKLFAGCSTQYQMTHADCEMQDKIEEKFYRRSLPIFKAMVAGNKIIDKCSEGIV